MATPFDTDREQDNKEFVGYSRDRLSTYKTYKRTIFQKNK
jgi:hypothetical protein